MFQSLLDQANDAARSGNHGAAVVLYRQCLLVAPKQDKILFLLGCCYQAKSDWNGARDAFEKVLALRPNAATHTNLAQVLLERGHIEGAIRHCLDAIVIERTYIPAYLAQGAALRAKKQPEESLAILRLALDIDPDRVETLIDIGVNLSELGRHGEAAASLEKARALRPGSARIELLLAHVYHHLGRRMEAFCAYQAALAANPHDASAYDSFTNFLCNVHMTELAVSVGKIAVQLAPDSVTAWFNLAAALMDAKQDDEALAACRTILELRPGSAAALLLICAIRERLCDWPGLETEKARVVSLIGQGQKQIPPLMILTHAASPSVHLIVAEVASAACRAAPGTVYTSYRARDAARLRIGYLSADFRTHAVPDLIAEVFELHDRDRFEVFGYGLSLPDKTPMGLRLAQAFDHVRDIHALSYDDMARTIHADGIDILIDLMGHTRGSATPMLALRPAPVQVNFLGYPGTMGASFMDYIIADRHIAPFEHAPFFAEKIVHLPHSYQPNDRKRPAGARRPTRAECGLPEQGFVFCCFNKVMKVSETVFSVWMEVLAATPGSVLWLFADERPAANLRTEAARHGISPERLVFAKRIPTGDHLARLSLADLFLDTLLYNAHTTASEALWMGVPVLSCRGDAFPARVGASLLHAVGLSDLITYDLEAYREKAIRIARSPDLARDLKSRLADCRASAPLFDMPRYTRNLERAFERMASAQRDGKAPEAFAISEES